MMGNYNRRGEEGMGKLSQHRSQKTVVVYYLIKKQRKQLHSIIISGRHYRRITLCLKILLRHRSHKALAMLRAKTALETIAFN
jgi:hypothetical protein